MEIRAFFVGGAVGAATVYLLDPESGRRRRSRLRDRTASKMRRVLRRAERKERYLKNVVEGRIAERRVPGPDNRDPDDLTLEDRIRSSVFRRPEVLGRRLVLEVEDRVVIVRGEILSPEESTELARRIAQDPAVRDVVMMVHLPGELPPNKEDALRATEIARRSGR
jgi:hypothetical protein